jgi:cyclic pyranopterin phosphate synthase
MTRQRPIHDKPIVYRRAVAEGELRLNEMSRLAIRTHNVEKGEPLAAGEVAGLVAVKRTPELLPHCHPIPITGSSVELRLTETGVHARAEVETLWRTGVEMEALTAVAIALLTVWDMIKYLEKDPRGRYPTTRIGKIRVVTKEKRALPHAP